MSAIADRVREALEHTHDAPTQRQLAVTVDITPDALSRSLSGHRRFSAEELARIADALDADLQWLITGEQDPLRPRLAARHTFDHQTRTRDVPGRQSDGRVLSDVALAYRQASDLMAEETSELPTTAAAVRERLGADFVRPFADRLERELGIDVVRLKGLSTAWSMVIGSRSVILVPATGNWFRENWDIAHELAHLALGHLHTGSATSAEETAANAFAAELLTPAAVVRRINWAVIDAAGLADLVWDWGVSTEAVWRRLGSLGIAIPPVVEQWAEPPTQRLLRFHRATANPFDDEITRRMDDAAARRFPVSLQTHHRELISTGRIGKSTLAWMLDVEPDTLDVDAPAPDSLPAEQLVELLGL